MDVTAERHEHYDHYDVTTLARLDGFFGDVDRRMNQRIACRVQGPVLDFGCGFGNLVEHLRSAGIEAEGIDLLDDFIAAGRTRYPLAKLTVGLTELPDIPARKFATVILKDVLHHLYDEADAPEFLAHLAEKGVNRVVVFEPNPMPILLLARKLIGHKDPTCSPKQAREALAAAGFRVESTEYFDVVAFPASGGYVGRELIRRGFWSRVLLRVDGILEGLFRVTGTSSWFCWRYLTVAVRE